MNVFQLSFNERLRSWHDLRNLSGKLSREEFLVAVDAWWQQAPLIKHHLHWNDSENWTSPWDILSENTYCPLTRAVGICYTLLLCGVNDIRLVTATDQIAEEHFLVLVDGVKYTLSWWPNMVLNTNQSDFTIIRELPLDSITTKLK